MTRRTVREIAVLIGAAALALGACRERGRPDPNVRMAISHEPAAAAAAEAGAPNAERAPEGAGAAQGQGNPEIPSRLEVPPEVEQAYGAVRIGWSGASSAGPSARTVTPLACARRSCSRRLRVSRTTALQSPGAQIG